MKETDAQRYARIMAAKEERRREVRKLAGWHDLSAADAWVNHAYNQLISVNNERYNK